MPETDLTILLVDDSLIMRRIIASFLKKMGYLYVREASNVQEALDILDKEQIDLVFSDYSMPGLSGLELLKIIRSDPRKKELTFIMITAEAQLRQIVMAFQEGAHHYITKPFTQEYLEYVINKAIRL